MSEKNTEQIFNLGENGMLLEVQGDDKEKKCSLTFDTKGSSELKTTNTASFNANKKIEIKVNDAIIQCDEKSIEIMFEKHQLSLNKSGLNIKVGSSEFNISKSGINLKTNNLNIDATNIQQTASANFKAKGTNTQIEG